MGARLFASLTLVALVASDALQPENEAQTDQSPAVKTEGTKDEVIPEKAYEGSHPAALGPAPHPLDSNADPLAGLYSQSKVLAKNAIPFKVDLVYTWVDGSDLKWQEARKTQMKYDENQHNSDANKAFRYRNHDELKYSLRSVEKYASWVNHVYVVVCCNQKPSWLAESDMVTFVQHDDLFTSSDNLPTFNSFAIETVVDRIPGLSEHFLMLNDDMFFGAAIEYSDFFTEDGKPVINFEKDWSPMLDKKPTSTDVDAYIVAGANVNALLTDKYGEFKRYMVLHQAYPLTKSLYARARDVYSDAFTLTESHKFRESTDIIPHFLAMYIGIYEQKAQKSDSAPSNMVVQLTDDVDADTLALKSISPDSTKLLCMGDKVSSEENAEAVGNILGDKLNELFPDQSKFETGSMVNLVQADPLSPSLALKAGAEVEAEKWEQGCQQRGNEQACMEGYLCQWDGAAASCLDLAQGGAPCAGSPYECVKTGNARGNAGLTDDNPKDDNTANGPALAVKPVVQLIETTDPTATASSSQVQPTQVLQAGAATGLDAEKWEQGCQQRGNEVACMQGYLCQWDGAAARCLDLAQGGAPCAGSPYECVKTGNARGNAGLVPEAPNPNQPVIKVQLLGKSEDEEMLGGAGVAEHVTAPVKSAPGTSS